VKERNERFLDATNPQNKTKIAMKKRKPYAELEPVKKKKTLCLERFCHYYNNVKNKKNDSKGL